MVSAEELCVVDVYDLASDIGKECEKIIDLYGADALLKLMPKVINVLELLENIATRNESENNRMQELNDRIAHLESEKQEKAVFRQRFDKVSPSEIRSRDLFVALRAGACFYFINERRCGA